MKRIGMFLMAIALVISFTVPVMAQDDFKAERQAAFQREMQVAYTHFWNAIMEMKGIQEKWGYFQDGGRYDLAVDPTVADQTACESVTGRIWVADPGLCKGLITVGVYSGLNELYVQNAYSSALNLITTWWPIHGSNFQDLLD